jgi:hypothetical protein
MKMNLKMACLLSVLLFVNSCTKMDSILALAHQPATTYTPLNAADLAPVSELAIQLTRLAKEDVLPVAPYINVRSPGVEIENQAGSDAFSDRNVIIMDAGLGPEGTFTQRMLVEATDRVGRIDLRDDRITFLVRDPNAEEAAIIAGNILKNLSATHLNQLSASERAAFNDGLKAFQQSCGLNPDGIVGQNTAGCMGRQSSVIDIQALTSRSVYPSTPRHAVYIVPMSVIERNPGRFYNGFDSLASVKQGAVNTEDSAGPAPQESVFVAFVYFFDRVDPQNPISLRLCNSLNNAMGPEGQLWHAAPGKWPVVVETFKLDKISIGSGQTLYLRVFIKDGMTKRCISSNRIQDSSK